MVSNRRNKRRRELYSVTAGYPPDPPPEKYLPKIPYPDRDMDETLISLGPPVAGYLGELIWKYALYRGRMVDWALMLFVIPAESPIELATKGPRQRRQVERVDCCESEINRHVFTINSDPEDNLGERAVLRPLRANDADIVDSEFNHYYEMMLRDWPEGKSPGVVGFRVCC
jgi:hypothetical protein